MFAEAGWYRGGHLTFAPGWGEGFLLPCREEVIRRGRRWCRCSTQRRL